MSPRRAAPALLFAAAFLGSFLLLAAFVVRPLLTRRAPELPRLGSVPSFALAAHDGTKRSDRDLKGSVWVADFVFLRCGTICPVMTASMAALDRKLKDAPGVRFVSFDVDPEHDTVEGLAAYAKEHGAAAPRWTFLHPGDRKTILAIAREGFRLGLEQGTPEDTEPILHSSRFVLIDRSGEMRGTYDGTDEASMEALARDARRLERER